MSTNTISKSKLQEQFNAEVAEFIAEWSALSFDQHAHPIHCERVQRVFGLRQRRGLARLGASAPNMSRAPLNFGIGTVATAVILIRGSLETAKRWATATDRLASR
jgi:hypothetical protein